MSTTWLQKQKKGDLQDMAKRSGLQDGDEMLKDELIENLNAHLRLPANQTRFSSDSAFAEFYSKISPQKKSSGQNSDEAAIRKRKQSLKVKEELDTITKDAVDNSKALVAKTPKAVQKVAARVPLPPSPADVSNMIDRQTQAARRRLSNAYDKSGVDTGVELARDFIGSVYGIILASTVLEALSLRRAVFPWSYLFDVPYSSGRYQVYYPNLYMLAQPKFWQMTTLWATTSIIVPAAFAFAINLTRPSHQGVTTRRSSKSHYQLDPMTFNIVKGLLAYAVYARYFNLFGTFSELTIAETNLTILGGYQGIMIASGIGALVSLYDAVLKK